MNLPKHIQRLFYRYHADLIDTEKHMEMIILSVHSFLHLRLSACPISGAGSSLPLPSSRRSRSRHRQRSGGRRGEPDGLNHRMITQVGVAETIGMTGKLRRNSHATR